ncbi:MAG: hypothetical protein C5B55_13895 [Blastocatellia bacterium]|nr:MAG: hypothetical protein C5B55_13895 [Blastocatellia bacterium]
MRWIKGKFAWCLISLVCLTTCGGPSNKSNIDSKSKQEVFSSTPPFKTLEPDRYQAIRTVVVNNSTGTSEVSRTAIAKDGSARREETISPGKRVIYLDLPEGRFILLPESHIYAEAVSEHSNKSSSMPSLEDPGSELVTQTGSETVYRALGRESLNGRNLQKYQIVVNNSVASDVSNTETTVWIDDELGMPIRTEVKTTNGRTIIELSQIGRSVDKQQFQIPAGYQKVKPEVIRQELGRID